MKRLKLLMIALITLALLLPLSATAEDGLPYIRQLSQNTYTSTSLITPESYPEVYITPYAFSSIYVSQYREPYFLHFSCPANTFAALFEDDSALFIDMVYNRQYSYSAVDGYAYENFLSDCDVDEYILADGSDKLAVYIEPDRQRAYALIGAPEHKSIKLSVMIYDNSLSDKTEQDTASALTEMITDEVARLQASMTLEQLDAYWSAGRYAGFTVLSTTRNTNGLTMTYTLPEGFCVTEIDSEEATIMSLTGGNGALEVEFDMDSYSSVDYYLEREPEHVTTVTINDVEYRLATSWYNDESIMLAYADRVLTTTAGYSGDSTLYLTIDLDPENNWTDMDAVIADLTTVISGIQIDYDQTVTDYRDATPYPEADVPAAQGAPAADGAWVCPECGEAVTSNFCPNDGTAKPEEPADDGSWVCPECGETATTNFCPNDGTAKPE